MNPGAVVWIRGEVAQVTPRVLIVTCRGPGGAPIPYAFDPNGPIRPDGPAAAPEPDDLPVARPAAPPAPEGA